MIRLLSGSIFCTLVVFVTAGIGCRSDQSANAPASLQDTIPIVVPVSTFRIPISYALTELQSFLNQKIAGEFLETTISPTKNEKDQVQVKMRKLKDIQISSNGNNLVVRFPLQVTATILKSRINLITKGIKPVVTEVILELRTPVALDAGWNLVTHFNLDSIIWVKPPVVTIAGMDKDLTEKLDEALQKNKQKLTTLLDTEINKAVSLDKPVGKIWEDLQRPIVINKKPPQAYLKFICEGIGGDFRLEKDALVCFTTISTKVAIVTKTRLKAALIKLPPFSTQAWGGNYSNVSLYAFAEFDAINSELAHKLEGRSYTEKGFTTTIEKAKIFASDSGLTVELAATGDIDGKLVATGTPAFDSITQKFTLGNFQFQLSSSRKILSAGVSFLHDRIRDSVQRHLTVGLDSLIAKIPNIIEQAIAKGKTGKTIDVNVDDMRILSCDIKMDARRIHLLVRTTFIGAIQLKHINARKSILIKPKPKPKQEKV